jgi:hypothetical protein
MLCKTNGFRPGGRTCCARQMDFVSEGGHVVQDKWISSRRDEMFIDGKFKTFALR